MSYWEFTPYVSVAEKERKAKRKLEELRKKNPNMKPVLIKGSKLVSTWWGKAWNKNLESYADYSNRIGRGRSYVRHNAVLDLQIKAGTITSLVQGSASSPYRITIRIKPLSEDKWKGIQNACQGKFESLQELLDGEFPKALGEIFTDHKKGLFPSPSEISFNCSCPDVASMCKHIAATLYGVGNRLDSDPDLFFTLRNIKVEDLISRAVESKKLGFLKKAKKKSSRVIKDSNLSALFGIEMDEVDSFIASHTVKKAVKKLTTKKRANKHTTSKSKSKPAKKSKARLR